MEFQAKTLNFAQRQDHPYFAIRNPYNDKLKFFDRFLMRDMESETHRGKWKSEIFENQKPLHVEVGSGFGDFMHEFCQNHPELNFIGMDYRFKRAFEVAKRLAQLQVTNFRYLRASGDRLRGIFHADEVDILHLYFPDPWPKARHNKRRLFQKPFLDACHEILKPGGSLLIKTDHDHYFDWMQEHFEQYQDKNKNLAVVFKTFDLHGEDSPLPDSAKFFREYKTKFEKMYMERRNLIKAMVIQKNGL